MGIANAMELAEIVASAGLAQNVAALRALSDEGIQQGHMKLHARNIAGSIEGISPGEVDTVVETMLKKGKVRADIAEEIFAKIREN